MTNDVDGDILTVTCAFNPDDGMFAGSCNSAGGNGEYKNYSFSISFPNIQILFFRTAVLKVVERNNQTAFSILMETKKITGAFS